MAVKVIVKAGRFRRIRVDIKNEVYESIKAIAKRYGFKLEDALKILLLGDFIEGNATDEEITKLHERLEDIERELYALEGKWSSLKFKTYYISMDNQNLAIQISAMIAQNRGLRKKLGMKEKDYTEIEEKIRYYLNLKKV